MCYIVFCEFVIIGLFIWLFQQTVNLSLVKWGLATKYTSIHTKWVALQLVFPWESLPTPKSLMNSADIFDIFTGLEAVVKEYVSDGFYSGAFKHIAYSNKAVYKCG